MDSLLLDSGNVLLSGSGLLMFYTAYGDREALRGYKLAGTILIIAAVSLFRPYYVGVGFWLSFFLALPNYLYWITVCILLIARGLR